MKKFIAQTAVGIALFLAAAAGRAQEATSASRATGTSTPALGYLVSNFTIRDQATFQRYLDAVRPITVKYKGRAKVFTLKVQAVEGHPHPVMAVIEFPSFVDVERFYFSPEYTEVKKLRIASTEGSVMLTEGFVEPR
jgi:uncharacterized protein (DUF1330 family)